MKKQDFLDHTGLTEEQFYKKYINADTFFKSKSGIAFKAKYGAMLKKAQYGDKNKNGVPDYMELPSSPIDEQQSGSSTYPGAEAIKAFANPLNTNLGPQGVPPVPTQQFPGTMFKQATMPSVQYAQEKGMIGKGDTNLDIATDKKGPAKPPGMSDEMMSSNIGAIGSLGSSFQKLGEEQKLARETEAMAAAMRQVERTHAMADVDQPRMDAKYTRAKRKAFEQSQTGFETYPVLGTGTNILQGRHGLYMQDGGMTGMTNMFTPPNDIYTDGGFEPLEDSAGYTPLNNPHMMKTYRAGGYFPRAEDGYEYDYDTSSFTGGKGGKDFPYQSFFNSASAVGKGVGGPNAGADIGGSFGGIAGSAFGPGGQAGGKFAGEIAGRMLDPYPQMTEAANRQIMNSVYRTSGLDKMRVAHQQFTEDGGYMSHDWQPQVITHFGGNSMSRLLAPDRGMQTLRTGGNIRANEVDDIKVLSGGYLEPRSYNPYDEGQGVTSMIKGQSHDESNGQHTGVLMSYGKRAEGGGFSGEPDVEAENNETVKKIGGDAVIFGDIEINDKTVMGDPQFKGFYGKTFKKAMEMVSDKDKWANNKQIPITEKLATFVPSTPHEIAEYNGYAMMQRAFDQIYKINSSITKKAAQYQQTVNDTAADLAINAGDYSRGKITPVNPEEVARYGMSIPMAKNGITIPQAQGGTGKGKKVVKSHFIMPDGDEHWVYTDGTKTVKYKDGDVENYKVTNSEVVKMETDSKGNSVFVKKGGAKEIYYTNGRRVKYDEKGKVTGKSNFDATTGEITRYDFDLARNKITGYKQEMKERGGKVVDLGSSFRFVDTDGMYKDVDKKTGKEEAWTDIKPETLVQKITHKDGNVTKVYGDKEKDVFYKNGRLARFDKEGKLVEKANWDKKTGDITKWDSEKKGVATPAPAKDTARANAVTAANTKTNVAPVTGAATPVTGAAQTPGTPGPGGFTHQPVKKGNLPYSSVGDFQDEDWATDEGYTGKWMPKVYGAFADPARFTKILNILENYQGEGADALRGQLAKYTDPNDKMKFLTTQATNKLIGPIHKMVGDAIQQTETKTETKPKDTPVEQDDDEVYEVAKYKKSGWETLAGQLLPWIRKQPGEGLRGDQLAGEMFAISHNQEEPVQAQFKHSQLSTPYDISLQDQLNENQADFNSIAKRVGNNPEALSMLAGQKYAANSKVLGEQFRMNQAKQDQVYAENRALLNADQQYNLQIADQQYQRQQLAKSNTKAAMQEALNSISSKIGQNRLENRQLQTYANMFPDYSYDSSMRIQKTGAPANVDIPVIYNQKTGEPTYILEKDENGKSKGYRPVEPGETVKKAKKVEGAAPDIPPAKGTVPLTQPVTPKNNTTQTMGQATPTGPDIPVQKSVLKNKRYGGLVKAFKNL